MVDLIALSVGYPVHEVSYILEILQVWNLPGESALAIAFPIAELALVNFEEVTLFSLFVLLLI